MSYQDEPENCFDCGDDAEWDADANRWLCSKCSEQRQEDSDNFERDRIENMRYFTKHGFI